MKDRKKFSLLPGKLGVVIVQLIDGWNVAVPHIGWRAFRPAADGELLEIFLHESRPGQWASSFGGFILVRDKSRSTLLHKTEEMLVRYPGVEWKRLRDDRMKKLGHLRVH